MQSSCINKTSSLEFLLVRLVELQSQRFAILRLLLLLNRLACLLTEAFFLFKHGSIWSQLDTDSAPGTDVMPCESHCTRTCAACAHLKPRARTTQTRCPIHGNVRSCCPQGRFVCVLTSHCQRFASWECSHRFL